MPLPGRTVDCDGASVVREEQADDVRLLVVPLICNGPVVHSARHHVTPVIEFSPKVGDIDIEALH